MAALESKVPPPIVATILAILMWAASRAIPSVHVATIVSTPLAAALAAVGLLIESTGAVLFIRARTSVDPTNPCSASTLVVTGVYRFTRNPMYIGDLLILVAWATYLSNPLALVLAPAFVLYMNRFQIAAEERAMSDLFPEQYSAYKSRVRRWL
jgi:protein-S-isoprenylcysteine O-methyltransferase Ste14